ncbi:MAG: FRG domain-containing protein [Roseovarius sp.]
MVKSLLRTSSPETTGTVSGRVIRATSWMHLQEALHEDSWIPRIMRHRSHFLFRGHSRTDYPLVPGLARAGGRQKGLERHLLRNFKKYARSHLSHNEDRPENFWHWIALAQHHGLPTRLLDWTYSPLTAAHFACCDLADMDCDGAIWMVDYHGAHDLLPENLKNPLRRQGAFVYTDEMLSEVIPSLDDLSNPDPRNRGQVLFFEPPSISSRFVNQYACFSVGIGDSDSIDPWLSKNVNLWRKVVVPAQLKWEIRDKLDQSNISERVLFPGLDGLCAWLARQYYPRAL